MGSTDVELVAFGCPDLQCFLPRAAFRAGCQKLAKLTRAGQDLALGSVTAAGLWLLCS